MVKGVLGRQKADLDTEERLEGGLPVSPSMAEGPGSGPGDYCCCPWHGWRLGRLQGCAEPWGLPWERLSPLPTGLPGLYCRRAQDLQVLLRMASHRGVGEMGQGGADRGSTGHRGPWPGL